MGARVLKRAAATLLMTVLSVAAVHAEGARIRDARHEEATMNEEATRDDLWQEFCEQLKQAGRVMQREGVPGDELTRAEGYRHLARLIRMGFETTFEYADTQRPQLVQAVSATMLGEGETSDARYHQAFIDGGATYRVRGQRGSAPLIEFTVYAGKIGIEPTSRQIGALLERDLIVAEDGSFEVVLSPQEHAGNWIRTEPDATLLFIRQYAHDWAKTESARFEIEREGAVDDRAPLALAEIRSGLARTATFVDRAAHFWNDIVARRAAAEPNVFYVIPADPDPKRPTMPVGHRFAAGYFRLVPGEALIVSFQPVEVPYWGLDLTSYWFEPLSYGDHRSNVNNRTVQTESDGTVRVVIADERRDVPNWIDTRGHREGTMLFRWSRSEEPIPQLAVHVAKLSDL